MVPGSVYGKYNKGELVLDRVHFTNNRVICSETKVIWAKYGEIAKIYPRVIKYEIISYPKVHG